MEPGRSGRLSILLLPRSNVRPTSPAGRTFSSKIHQRSCCSSSPPFWHRRSNPCYVFVGWMTGSIMRRVNTRRACNKTKQTVVQLEPCCRAPLLARTSCQLAPGAPPTNSGGSFQRTPCKHENPKIFLGRQLAWRTDMARPLCDFTVGFMQKRNF